MNAWRTFVQKTVNAKSEIQSKLSNVYCFLCKSVISSVLLSYETSLHFLYCPHCTLCLYAFSKTFLISPPLSMMLFLSLTKRHSSNPADTSGRGNKVFSEPRCLLMMPHQLCFFNVYLMLTPEPCFPFVCLFFSPSALPPNSKVQPSSSMNPVYSPVQPGTAYGNPKTMTYPGELLENTMRGALHQKWIETIATFISATSNPHFFNRFVDV